MSKLQAGLLLLLIVSGAVAIRSYDITARSLWFDEAFSWRLIHFPFQEMIARDAQDVHPPLYYVILQGWGGLFGTSIFALRMFSVTCSGIAIFGAYLFSVYAFRSRKVGLLAALLLAVSGWNISYAWEARMYPLGMIFAFFSSYALLKAMREKKLGWFGLYALLATCLAYTHYYGFFTIFAQIILVIGIILRDTRGNLVRIVKNKITWYSIGVLLFALALYSPWLPIFLHQHQQVQASYWIPPL
ncbi:MAG TPA: glycosyltransferase family 39 protein, partial [Candidatus Andersenbacteria bacterium]|nr:glycosyltransferase family 39 protein [Candidatus Andersenbacteria bacterium]